MTFATSQVNRPCILELCIVIRPGPPFQQPVGVDLARLSTCTPHSQVPQWAEWVTLNSQETWEINDDITLTESATVSARTKPFGSGPSAALARGGGHEPLLRGDCLARPVSVFSRAIPDIMPRAVIKFATLATSGVPLTHQTQRVRHTCIA